MWWRAAEAVRASLRDSVAAPARPTSGRWCPRSSTATTAAVDPGLAEDFRTTGLTHLLAVSGTNLTLVVGFLLVLARWCGVRGRWLLRRGRGRASPGSCCWRAPSRACCGRPRWARSGCWRSGVDGRRRGTRALGVAVVVLLLVDPGLALTRRASRCRCWRRRGILLLAPGLARRARAVAAAAGLAEAVAVPAAAQLACTPLVAAHLGPGEPGRGRRQPRWSRRPSAPATVLGLAGGLLGLVWPPARPRCRARSRRWCVAWIVAVARRGAALPAAAVGWGTGVVPLAVLTAARASWSRWRRRALLRRRSTGVGCAVLLVRGRCWSGRRRPAGRRTGWVLVACDVGQGDALVLRAGPDSGRGRRRRPRPAPRSTLPATAWTSTGCRCWC